MPSSASATDVRSVNSAAMTMSQSPDGWATVAMSGANSDAIHRTNAFTPTRNRPIVERRSRPVNATITGRMNRWVSTRIAAAIRNATSPASRRSRMCADSVPNGNGWGTVGMCRIAMIASRTMASTIVSTMNRRMARRRLRCAVSGTAAVGRGTARLIDLLGAYWDRRSGIGRPLIR